jgi:predicted PurR-regulated permease PerM
MIAETHRFHVMRIAIIVMAVVVAAAAFHWLRGILTPFAIALFLMVIIDGFARVLEHRVPGFPRKAALPVALTVSGAAFVVIAYLVAENIHGFVTQLVGYEAKINALIAQTGAVLHIQVPATIGELIQQLNPSKYVGPVAESLRSVAEDTIFVLIYLGFLLASRHTFKRKVVTIFPDHEEREHAVRLFERMRSGVERYLWVQTVTGLIIAGASYALMAGLGLTNAFFWAFLIFIAAYVPIVGAAVGILLPPVFALVQFDTYWQAVVLLAGAETIHFVVGNIVTPRMQGQSLNVDPVVVLLSLAFWGAIWGVPGMFLSTPLTVTAMVILVQFPGTRWIAVLLSADGAPEKYAEEESPDPSEPPSHHAEHVAPEPAPKPRPRRKSS